MDTTASRVTSAWRWVPTLYYGQGLPYVVVITVSTVLYKNLGVSNTDLALATSWLYLPWVIKPLWSPLIELHGRKRQWIGRLQFVLAAGFALVGLAVPTAGFFPLTAALFWLLALASATHDIAADGFYLFALAPDNQARFVGVRSTFYRLALLSGQGGLVFLAGWLARRGTVTGAWSVVFWLAAVVFFALALYHTWILPRPDTDRPLASGASQWADFLAAFAAFFRKPGIGRALAFLLLYRFAEAQLLKLVNPFLLDARAAGGLGLTDQQVGVLYGGFGVLALVAGGLVGGLALARGGLRRWLWPMIVAMYLPNTVFIYLALAQPQNLAVIGAALTVEQFGYGFGFSAYLVFLMQFADGEHRTAHYAIGTGFMALGMMLPGLGAGWLEDKLGYVHFFGWVCLAAIPSFAATALVRPAARENA